MKKTPKRVNIEVTPEDIERAKISDSYKCVVAQAVARTVATATNVDVDTQSIRFTVEGERRVYLTPYAVQGYVIAFDAGEAIEPFSFQLRDPKIKHRVLLTEEGKVVAAATSRARRAAKKKVAATPLPEPSDADSEDTSIDLPKEAAKAAYAAARAEHPGPLKKKVSGSGQSPPRVWKKKSRAYGHRLLRINRIPGDTAKSRW